MDAGRESERSMNRTTVERKSDRELVVTRTFNGPAHLVFEAWSKPELFKRWWVPKSMGMTLRSCEMDVRTGGKYRLGFGDGMDFSAAAIRYSNAQDALDGGDLGWRRYDEVPETFANLAEGMQPGQVSQVLRGPSGFHIVKLIEKRSSGQKLVTEYHARHIEINVTEVVTSDDAQKTVRDIRARIVDGHEDFAKLAKQYSQDPNSANGGGDMGWFPIDQYGTRVAETLAAMKDNDISQPFQTDVGWHIVQLLGSRQQDRTDDAKREQARDVLRNRKAEDEYENFLRQMRSEAYTCASIAEYASPSLPQCGAETNEKKPTAP